MGTQRNSRLCLVRLVAWYCTSMLTSCAKKKIPANAQIRAVPSIA